MEEQNKIAALEAVLFTIGDSVEVGKLAEVIGEDVRTTKNCWPGCRSVMKRKTAVLC